VSLTPRERRWLIGIGLCYAAVVIPIGIRKGGDFTQELTESERLLRGLPLYVANPEGGIWWPPFTAFALVPFALVARWSLALAKACWSALNVFSLGWSVVRARGWTTGWAPVVLALAAVGKPLQSNYEHLNLTPILLALIVTAAADLEARRDVRAGWWIGLATAIKGFPALLLLYFAYRRRWRACATGLAVAGALTVGAMLPLGPAGSVGAVRDWLRLANEGAVVTRWGTQSLQGFGVFYGWPTGAVLAIELGCLAVAIAALRRPTAPLGTLADVGVVTLLAVLLSPIAWLYYYTLAFPAWVATLARPTQRAPWLRALLLIAGALTSGVLTFDLYPRSWEAAAAANYTWGGLALLAALVIDRRSGPVRPA
jgi:alpha-1,2-mannosyltransferase